jgi:membrane-associated phospholipid phosphatase
MNAALFHFINDGMRSPALDVLFPVFSDKDLVVIPLFAALCVTLYFGGRRTRTGVLALVLALAIADFGSEEVLKPLIGAMRPYAVEDSVHLHRNGQWMEYKAVWYDLDSRKSFGMPSSHAANIAAAALVLTLLWRPLAWVAVPLAVMVGLSRVYTGNHYPVQVLAGWAWGAACGYAAWRGAFAGVNRWRGPPAPETPPRPVAAERRAFYWLLLLWGLGNFLFIHLPLFGLAGDEAQYWDWSRRMALGYYSKPPMIAYVMDLLVSAGGNQEWAIRSGAVMFSVGTLALVYALTLRMTRNERAALVAALAALAMPVSWAGSVILTIDPLLVFFWTLALYAFHGAVTARGPAWGWWLLTGFALGCGLLSKYTAGVLVLALGLYLLTVDRPRLRTAGPWVALAVALLMQGGVLYWNALHGWVSFRHTAAIGAGDHWSLGQALAQAGSYVGAQLGVASPILFGLFVWAVVVCARRYRADRDAALLALSGGTLFVFYFLVSFRNNPEPNWPVATYPAAAVALGWAYYRTPAGGRPRRWLVAALVLGCALGVSLRSTDLLYLAGSEPPPGASDEYLYLAGLRIDPTLDPTNALRGGPEIGAALREMVGEPQPFELETPPFYFSDRYMLTAWLSFYAPGRPKALCFTWEDRRNQYTVWGGWDAMEGRDAIFVTGGGRERAEAYIKAFVGAGAFASGEYLGEIEVRRGHTEIKTFGVTRFTDYYGEELNAPGDY